MSFRDNLSATTRGQPRAIAALLGQRGTSRSDGVLSSAGIAISATVAKFKTTVTAWFAIAGLTHSKVATDNLVFSAAHTVTAGKWGSILLQINAAGAISSKVVASPQAYASQLEARNATPAADAANVPLGILEILADREETDGLRAIATLAISATAAKFKTTTVAAYKIAGVDYTKAATDLLVFSAAHVVTATKFGISLVQINAAGVISTKEPLATQAYADAPTALAALPAPDAGNIELGYITIAAGVADFTMNTTALTGVSGFVDATPAVTHDFVANTDGLDAVTLNIRTPTAVG